MFLYYPTFPCRLFTIHQKMRRPRRNGKKTQILTESFHDVFTTVKLEKFEGKLLNILEQGKS